MKPTIKTVIYSYLFDTRKDADATLYRAFVEKRIAAGSRVFCAHGGSSYYDSRFICGLSIELETNCLFDNQWNTAPIPNVSEKGLRVFDWAEDYPIDFDRHIKRGHYLEITREMIDIRANTLKCGYCGRMESIASADVFCPHCLDSPYLKVSKLHLLRMLPVSREFGTKREPLTDAESAALLPRYRAAQLHGATERGRARIAANRERIETDYRKTIEDARIKRDAAEWIINHCPQILENWIFYPHTGRHCFGWRNPIDAALLPDLLAAIDGFPFPHDIKCANGQKLSVEV